MREKLQEKMYKYIYNNAYIKTTYEPWVLVTLWVS